MGKKVFCCCVIVSGAKADKHQLETQGDEIGNNQSANYTTAMFNRLISTFVLIIHSRS
jgi:hypothetical protein